MGAPPPPLPDDLCPQCPQCNSIDLVERVEEYREDPLQYLSDRMSLHEERLTSTGLLLMQLERQLRSEFIEATAMAEAQRRSNVEANKRKPVPKCVIERFEDVEIGPRGIDERCCICDEAYAAMDSACRLPSCKHVFHRSCVTTWLRLKNTCPMCRNELPTVPSLKDLEALSVDELLKQLGDWNLNHETILQSSGDGSGVGKDECVASLAALLHGHLAERPKDELDDEEYSLGAATGGDGGDGQERDQEEATEGPRWLEEPAVRQRQLRPRERAGAELALAEQMNRYTSRERLHHESWRGLGSGSTEVGYHSSAGRQTPGPMPGRTDTSHGGTSVGTTAATVEDEDAFSRELQSLQAQSEGLASELASMTRESERAAHGRRLAAAAGRSSSDLSPLLLGPGGARATEDVSTGPSGLSAEAFARQAAHAAAPDSGGGGSG